MFDSIRNLCHSVIRWKLFLFVLIFLTSLKHVYYNIAFYNILFLYIAEIAFDDGNF